jgi:hypothetical protein
MMTWGGNVTPPPSPSPQGGGELCAVNSARSIVIPAKAGIQLHFFDRSKLDPDLRRGDDAGQEAPFEDHRVKPGDDD